MSCRRGRPACRHHQRRRSDSGRQGDWGRRVSYHPAGYRRAISFLTDQGEVVRVGVEGAASYGAGISRVLRQAAIAVVEVERPTRSVRRRAGKSDRLDAYHAARMVLAERHSPVKDSSLDGLRALQAAYRSAVKAQTAAINQITSVLVAAPDPVRARFRGLTCDQLAAALLPCRGFHADPIVADTMVALKVLAERHRGLSRQVQILTDRIDALVSVFNPALRAAFGVGPVVAAQLLITAGKGGRIIPGFRDPGQPCRAQTRSRCSAPPDERS